MGRPRYAVYGGSFDPPTFGHIDVLKQAVDLFDHIYVVVAENAGKQHWFNAGERVLMLEEVLRESGLQGRIEVRPLLAGANLFRYAETLGAQWAIRGIRGPRDLEDERDLRAANRALTPGVRPVYILANPELSHISSSMVRSIVGLEGWQQDIRKFVPEFVAKILEREGRR